MKKKILKLLTTRSLAVLFGYGVYVYGCAGDWWSSSFSSVFSPEITVSNKQYEPFFYDDYTTFYNGYSIQRTTELFKEENVADWTAYLQKYDKNVVEYYLYNKEVTPLLKQLSATKNKEDALIKQPFKYKLDASDKKTERFLLFLKVARN